MGRNFFVHEDYIVGNEDGTECTTGEPSLLIGQTTIDANNLIQEKKENLLLIYHSLLRVRWLFLEDQNFSVTFLTSWKIASLTHIKKPNEMKDKIPTSSYYYKTKSNIPKHIYQPEPCLLVYTCQPGHCQGQCQQSEAADQQETSQAFPEWLWFDGPCIHTTHTQFPKGFLQIIQETYETQ